MPLSLLKRFQTNQLVSPPTRAALLVEEYGGHGRSKCSGRDLIVPLASERAIEAPSAVVISDPCLAGSSPPPLFPVFLHLSSTWSVLGGSFLIPCNHLTQV